MLGAYTSNDPQNGPAPDDRRNHPRRKVKLRAEAIRIANTIAAHRDPALTLAVSDLSEGGLAATVNMWVNQGETLALFFPSHLGQHVFDLNGRVVRCQPSKYGFDIGLQFNSLAA